MGRGQGRLSKEAGSGIRAVRGGNMMEGQAQTGVRNPKDCRAVDEDLPGVLSLSLGQNQGRLGGPP